MAEMKLTAGTLVPIGVVASLALVIGAGAAAYYGVKGEMAVSRTREDARWQRAEELAQAERVALAGKDAMRWEALNVRLDDMRNKYADLQRSVDARLTAIDTVIDTRLNKMQTMIDENLLTSEFAMRLSFLNHEIGLEVPNPRNMAEVFRFDAKEPKQ